MRNRSIGGNQWTDAEFLSCSPLARLLALALRNEADDNGIFKWSPVDLRIRLLPVDNCDMAALLLELLEYRQIASYEVNGRKYGVVRNFHKFQKPKYPSYSNPIPGIDLGDGYEFRELTELNSTNSGETGKRVALNSTHSPPVISSSNLELDQNAIAASRARELLPPQDLPKHEQLAYARFTRAIRRRCPKAAAPVLHAMAMDDLAAWKAENARHSPRSKEHTDPESIGAILGKMP